MKSQENFKITEKRIPLEGDELYLSTLDSDSLFFNDVLLEKYDGQEETVRIPEGVHTICEGAFAGNTKLKTVIIPEGVYWINDNAFCDCTNLETVIWPNSLTYVGNAFINCYALKEVKVNQCPPYTFLDSDKIVGPLESCPDLMEDTFVCCLSLTRVDIPLNIFHTKAIFRDCPQLREIRAHQRMRFLSGNEENGYFVEDETCGRLDVEVTLLSIYEN